MRAVKGVYCNVGGAVENIIGVYVRVGGVVRKVFGPPSISVPAGVNKSHLCYGGGCPSSVALSVSATATGKGGSEQGGTYQWSYVSGDLLISATGTGGRTATFSRTVAQGEAFTAIWKCTYTVDGVSVSANCEVNFHYFYESGA